MLVSPFVCNQVHVPLVLLLNLSLLLRPRHLSVLFLCFLLYFFSISAVYRQDRSQRSLLHTILLHNWSTNFLRDKSNKKELFLFVQGKYNILLSIIHSFILVRTLNIIKLLSFKCSHTSIILSLTFFFFCF